MRKNLVCVLVVLLWVGTFAFGAGGVLPGSGTEADPYLIEDLTDFDAFSDDANAGIYWAEGVYTKLMCDIDLIGREYDKAVIAYSYNKYDGILDGNNKTIYSLSIYGDTSSGLIKIVGETGILKNIKVSDVQIDSQSCNAGVLAYYNAGSIINCSASGKVNGYSYIGGLVGINIGSVANCSSSCIVNGVNKYIGGVCGANNGGTISNSN